MTLIKDHEPKYRWGQIVLAFGFGFIFGLIVDLGLGFILALFAAIISRLFAQIPEPPEWLLVPFLLILAVLPIYFAFAWAFREAGDQLREDRAAVNRCVQCGYSLRGLRRISDRCPECGKVFRKWS